MSDEFKAAAWTALFSFVGLFGASLVGWMQQVVEWANAGSDVTVFPDVTVLGKAAVAAALSAVAGLVNFAYRWAQAKGVPLPGAKPAYVPAPRQTVGFDMRDNR